MPSKEDICVVQETLPSSKKDFLTAKEDVVEELVAALKHNLQLKSKPHYSMCRKHRRMSPYSAPARTYRRSAGDKENAMEHSTRGCRYCILKSKPPITVSDDSSDDAYERLQVLIREGGLVKEAVRRIQLNLQNRRPKKYKYEIDTESESEIIDVEN